MGTGPLEWADSGRNAGPVAAVTVQSMGWPNKAALLRKIPRHLPAEVLERIFDRQGHPAAQRAEAGLFHGVQEVVDQSPVDLVGAVRPRLRDQFLAAGAAEAAGEALAAALIGGEFEQVLDVFDHREV